MPLIGDPLNEEEIALLEAWILAGLPEGAAPAGSQAYEALRVEARRPRLGVDSDHRTIPNELSWLTTAVHLDKGCYRGQETVAKVHHLGQPPRRLVMLHLDGTDEHPPAHGTPVALDGKKVGYIGTAVQQNLGVQLQNYEYRIVGQNLRAQYGTFDFLTDASIRHSSDRSPTDNPFVPSGGRSTSWPPSTSRRPQPDRRKPSAAATSPVSSQTHTGSGPPRSGWM